MNEETNKPNPEAAAPAPAPSAAAPAGRGGFRGQGGRGGDRRGGPGGQSGRGGRAGGGRDRRPRMDVPAEADYEEKNIEVARVTRVTKGGKRMRFRVLTVIGNRKGRAGYGLAKGVDVAGATAKATTQARKALFTVPLVKGTIPHAVEAKFGAAYVILKPAPEGTGVKAGGAVRIVLELAGVPNVVSKILGSKNKTNNVKATFAALRKLRLSTRTAAAQAPAEKTA
jgi:small subunit ribosomal protein S5